MQYDNLRWRCSCGEDWPVNEGGQAWRHQMEAIKAGEGDQHVPVGLIDTATGDVLVKGFSTGAAVKKGITQANQESWYQRKKRGEARKDRVEDTGALEQRFEAINTTPKREVSPVRARMAFVDIPIPADLWYLFIMAMAAFPELEESKECFSEWLVSCVYSCYLTYPKVFGLHKLIESGMLERGLVSVQSGGKNDE